MIHHWCPRRDWPPAGDGYEPESYGEEGFVHCSYLDQVTATATALYAGRDDLVILTIDEAGLPVVVEDCYELGEPFPHVYGPIPRAAVRAVTDFPSLGDGSFALPPDLPGDEIGLPPAAARALEHAADCSFTRSSLPAVGRLLARLVGAAPGGLVAELGTGTGHAAAWMTSALRPDQRLVTVDTDPGRAAAARALLADDDRVEVVHGRWEDVIGRGPFALVFADAPGAKERADLVAPALVPGGVAVIDDLTPQHLVDAAVLAADPARNAWLGHPLLDAVERQAAQDQAVIVARRR